MTDESLGLTILCQTRAEGTKSREDPRTLLIGNRQRVSGRGIERTGLTYEERELAEKEHSENLRREGRFVEGRAIAYPDRAYRGKRRRPLLVVHLIQIKGDGPANPFKQPVVAWSISFPDTQMEEKRVEYVVNTTWLRENFRDDVDDDEMRGDDS